MSAAHEADTRQYGNLSYNYPVEKLWSGASFGSRACFARTDRLSNLDGFWLAANNQWLCGKFDLRIEAEGVPLTAESTSFYPGHQQTALVAPGLSAEKLAFVPYGDGAPGAFYSVVRLKAEREVGVRVHGDVRWPAVIRRSHTKQPTTLDIQRRVRQWTEPGLILAQTAPFRIDRLETILGNADEVCALRIPDGGATSFAEPGRALLVYELRLAAGQEVVLPFTLLATMAGEAALRAALAGLTDWEAALNGTVAAYQAVLDAALLYTPDPLINRGMQWAKANTIRVQHDYRQGSAFTNDPPQDIVVVRDCAWYGLGADWLTPGFVRDMYGMLLRHGIEEGGKLTEFIHADTGRKEDYALNVNDDTPLFVVGAYHHFLATGNPEFGRQVYPAVRDACDWLLSQRRDGLVWCTVSGSDIWGNATWRNIIPGYNLNGAVTEINALTYWALNTAAKFAGDLQQADDAGRWTGAAKELRAAIEQHLFTPDGFYLLNRTAEEVNQTRTADLVFPVLGEVAAPERAKSILDLLYGGTFYTPYGIHTVATDQAEYHPDFGFGLMGGLWPNLTAWVAYAGRKVYPDRLVEMMGSVYALSEPEEPLAGGHLVPGEFPEWFDGETFESRGMAMSPWMPPTYIWLGVEGLAGLQVGGGTLTVNPNLPPGWNWLALRNVPYGGEQLSLFVHDGHLYTTRRVESGLPQTLFSADISAEAMVDNGSLTPVALEGTAGIVLLLGASQTTSATVRLRGAQEAISLQAGEAKLLRWNDGKLQSA